MFLLMYHNAFISHYWISKKFFVTKHVYIVATISNLWHTQRGLGWYGMPQVIQMTSKDSSSVEEGKGRTTINDASKSVMHL